MLPAKGCQAGLTGGRRPPKRGRAVLAP